MKRTIKKTIAIAIALAMACTAVLAESVKIDSAHFPDENFRKYIKRIADRNGDGYLSDAERMDVMRVDVSGSKVTSVKGIEFLPNLTELEISKSPISELDLSGNPNLNYLSVLGTKLKTVDLCGSVLAKSAGRYQIEKEPGGIVLWLNVHLWVEKSMTVTDGDKVLYIPEMYPFIYVDPFTMLFEDENYDPPKYVADVIIQDTETYSDEELTQLVGSIPANTAVLTIPDYGGRGADWAITGIDSKYCEIVNYGDSPVYVKPSVLWRNLLINPLWIYTTYPKGTTVYQRPDYSSATMELKKETAAAIINENDGWCLIMVDKDDLDPYCFVPVG